MARKKESWADILDNLRDKEVIPHIAHRILLWGAVGSGKSSWAQTPYRVICHKQMAADDWLGCWQLKDGTTYFNLGPAPRAMDTDGKGSPLVIDEIELVSADCKGVMNAVLDDLTIAGLLMPDGTRVTPKPGFCVIATTNATPNALPESVLDRFEIILRCFTPAPGIYKAIKHDGIRKCMKTHYDEMDKEAQDKFVAKLSVRRFSIIDKLVAHGLDAAQACFVSGRQAEDANAFAVA